MTGPTPFAQAMTAGLIGAHDAARQCLGYIKAQPEHAAFWRDRAKPHFERARWYIASLRMEQNERRTHHARAAA